MEIYKSARYKKGLYMNDSWFPFFFFKKKSLVSNKEFNAW